MAKSTTVTRKLDIVDLIRDRKLFPLLDVPALRVTVTIEVTTSATIGKPTPAPSSKMARLEAAAKAKLDEYEDIITKECERFSKKIDGLIKAGKQKEAEAVVSEVNASIKKALATAEGAADKAVEDARKKEAHGDALLTEARVKTTVKVVFSGVSFATSAAKLVATSGADVTSYFSIAKTLISLGLELHQQLKDEPKLREDLVKGIGAYLDLRGTVVMQAAKRYGLTSPGSLPGFPQVFSYVAESILRFGAEVTKGRDKKQIAKELLDFTIKGVAAQLNDAEKSRQMYRNHTVKMRHKIDDISATADKLTAAMRKATNLKEGVKIGAECMQVKAKVRSLAGVLDECIGFLDGMEIVMKGFGLECDDRTIMDKLKAIDKSTIFSEGAGLVLNVQSLYSLFKAVQAAAV
jgi:hypothetical protein